MASLALGGLCPHFKEKIEGYDDPYISQLHIRALLQENKFKRAKECCKAHQSSTYVDCESNTLDDDEKEIIRIWIIIRLCWERNQIKIVPNLLCHKKQV